MGHPSENYIKYLLIRTYNQESGFWEDRGSLTDTLEGFGLPHLSSAQFNSIVGKLKVPEWLNLEDPKHAETQDFMRVNKVYYMWRPDGESRRVLIELLGEHHLIKLDIHILLMGGIPHNVVAEKVNQKYRMSPEVTEGMIDVYAHYFWKVSNATHEEWARILADSPFEDALLLSLHGGEQQALYRAGFNPKVEGSMVLRESMRQAYFRLLALRRMPDSKTVIDSYAKLTSKILSLYEVLYAEGAGLQEQLREFRTVMLKHKDPDVKSVDTLISKLTGGSYSNDGERGTEEMAIGTKELQ